MSLTEPTSKMSKSHRSDRSRILITDSSGDIKAKIGSALTDSIPGISYDPTNRPGISNLLDIMSIFDAQGRSSESLAQDYSDLSPRRFKEMVSDAIISGLGGIRERYLSLVVSNDSYLDKVEAEGARKARKSADETMEIVKAAIGL